MAVVVGPLDAAAVDRLAHQLGEFLADARRRVVVDLGRVSRADPSALSELGTALARAAGVFERVVLVCALPAVVDAVSRRCHGLTTTDSTASALALLATS